MNAEYVLSVINLLRREANSVAGIGADSRLGKSGLTIAELERLEDRLERELTRSMTADESVTESGDSLAREIKARYFATVSI